MAHTYKKQQTQTNKATICLNQQAINNKNAHTQTNKQQQSNKTTRNKTNTKQETQQPNQ